MKQFSKICLFIFALFGVFFYFTSPAHAQTADHVVISQVQLDSIDGDGGAGDDFVELYNPTDQEIDISGWNLRKKLQLKSGSGSSIGVFPSGSTIPAYGFFLWASSDNDYADSISADVSRSQKITSNNSIVLLDRDDNTIDSLAWGEGHTDPFVEGSPAEEPPGGSSLERKPGGGEGNGEDTDDNSADFFIQSTPHPRNSSHASEQPAEDTEEDAEEGSEQDETEEDADDQSDSADSDGQSDPAPALNLQISEIMVNPEGRDSGNEWVELYNAGSNSADLTGWLVDDKGSSSKPGTSALELIDVTIAPGGYKQIVIPKGYFALNNSVSDTVRIFNLDSALRLQQDYPAPAKQGQSYARDSQDNWQWTSILTPGSANEFEKPIEYSDTLRINELHPDPLGLDEEGEFIEIHNFGTDAVDLSGWIVADARKKYTITEDDYFETEIPAGGYFAVYREVSGISLNNSGDERVQLYAPDESLLESLQYNAKGEGNKVIAWDGDKYVWSDEATPGEENIILTAGEDEESQKQDEPDLDGPDTIIVDSSPDNTDKDSEQNKKQNENKTPADEDQTQTDSDSSSDENSDDSDGTEQIQEVALADIRKLERDILVRTTGVVSASYGLLDEDVIYLSGSGMRVIFESPPDIDFKIGDLVSVTGLTSSYHNEFQLKVSDASSVSVLASEADLEASLIKTGDVDEPWEGSLVQISGTVTKNQGNTFFVDDSSGEARITIQDETEIVKPAIRKGDEITVIGIVSQFNSNYRILPRFQSDLSPGVVSGEKTLPRTGMSFWLSLAILAGFMAKSAGLLLLFKRKTC